MATKFEVNELGKSFRKVLGSNSAEMLEISNAHVGKTIEELVEALKPQDCKMAVEFLSPLIRELGRMGVDLSPAWKQLDESGLVEWAKE